MDWPDERPQVNKLRYALRLAGALGYIGLIVGDQLTVTLLRSDRPRGWGPHRGRRSMLRLFEYLESITAGGITDLELALRDYALRAMRPACDLCCLVATRWSCCTCSAQTRPTRWSGET